MEQQKTQTFQLPLGIVNNVDIGRLLREIETLNTFMRSAEVRRPGTTMQLPKTSKLLDEFLEINKKSALKDEDRTEIKKYLEELRRHAPTIHMSFSADPSPLFTQRLIGWLRQNIHPSVLLQVGLQPTIGAGTIVRTTNQYFDFSLREYFKQKKPLLLAKLRSDEALQAERTSNAQPPKEPAAASVTTETNATQESTQEPVTETGTVEASQVATNNAQETNA